MNKWLTGALALIVLVAAGGPPVFGLLLEREIRKGYDDTPYADMFAIHVDEYQRGLYSSNAKVRFAPTEAYMSAMTQGIGDGEEVAPEAQQLLDQLDSFTERLLQGLSFDVEVKHGPVSLHDGVFVGMGITEMTLDAKSPAFADLQDQLQVPYLLRAVTRINLDSSGDFVADIPAFTVALDASNVSYTGATLSGDYSSGMRKMSYGAELGSVEGSAEGGLFRINDIRAESDTEMISRMVGIGTTTLSVESIEFSSPMQSGSVEQLRLDADMRLNDARDKMDLDFLYSVDTISGIPGAALADLKLGFRLANLDVAELENYMNTIMPTEKVEPISSQEFNERVMRAMYDIVRDSAEISIDPLSFSLNGDRFDSAIAVKLDGSKMPEYEQLSAVGQQVLMEALTVSAHVDAADDLIVMMVQGVVAQQVAASVPPDSALDPMELQAAVISQTPVFIESLVQQGFLTESAEGYRGAVEYGQGQLQLNGIEVPLGALLQ